MIGEKKGILIIRLSQAIISLLVEVCFQVCVGEDVKLREK